MVFSSLSFLLLFMPLMFGAYFASPKKWRNLVLLIFSFVFYAWGEPVYIVLMLFSTVFDYYNGIMLAKAKLDWQRQAVLILSLAGNLGLLGFFKYGTFFADNINTLLGSNIEFPNLPLPIGISFYTFQTLSYTIDVYRKKFGVQKNFIAFACYVAMFPQLVAGPIVRYEEIDESLLNRKETLDKFTFGIKLFTAGLCKKVLLANSAGQLWDSIKMQPFSEMQSLSAIMGIIAFAFQIYFDFSGYSDMAIGLGAMMGFKFSKNFDYPYIASSITDFWRRWHISLSTWFREYLYIPLGGNRCKPYRNIINLLIVWCATGFWHGASWNFTLWGLYFALLLILEKYFLKDFLKKASKAIGHIYTLTAVLFGWVLFSFESISEISSFLKAIFRFGFDSLGIYNLISFGGILIACALFSTPLPLKLYNKLNKSKVTRLLSYATCCIMLFICIIFIVDSSYNPFLYFRF